jgi:hypothetical protein
MVATVAPRQPIFNDLIVTFACPAKKAGKTNIGAYKAKINLIIAL